MGDWFVIACFVGHILIGLGHIQLARRRYSPTFEVMPSIIIDSTGKSSK